MDILDLTITEFGQTIWGVELKLSESNCAERLLVELTSPPYSFTAAGAISQGIFQLSKVETTDALRLLGILKVLKWEALSSNTYAVPNINGKGGQGLAKNFVFSKASVHLIAESKSVATTAVEPPPETMLAPVTSPKPKPRKSISQVFIDLLSNKGDPNEKVQVLSSTTDALGSSDISNDQPTSEPLVLSSSDQTSSSSIKVAEESSIDVESEKVVAVTSGDPQNDFSGPAWPQDQPVPVRRKSFSQRISSFFSPGKPSDGASGNNETIDTSAGFSSDDSSDGKSSDDSSEAPPDPSLLQEQTNASDVRTAGAETSVNIDASVALVTDNIAEESSGTASVINEVPAQKRRKSFSQKISSFLSPGKKSSGGSAASDSISTSTSVDTSSIPVDSVNLSNEASG